MPILTYHKVLEAVIQPKIWGLVLTNPTAPSMRPSCIKLADVIGYRVSLLNDLSCDWRCADGKRYHQRHKTKLITQANMHIHEPYVM